MIMKKEYQDRIEDYLLNRMSNDERSAFEQELKEDAELREQYEFVSMVKTALMLENIEKDIFSIKTEEESFATVSQSANEESDYSYESTIKLDIKKTDVRPFPKRYALYWVSGIAALFVVGLFIINHFLFVNNPSLPEMAYVPSSDSCLTNINTDGYVSSESHGLGNMRRQDFECSSAPSNEYEYYGKGSSASSYRHSLKDIKSLLARGDYDNAIAQIEENEVRVNSELMLLEREINSRGDEDNA